MVGRVDGTNEEVAMRKIGNTRFKRRVVTVLSIITIPVWIFPAMILTILGLMFSDIHESLWGDGGSGGW